MSTNTREYAVSRIRQEIQEPVRALVLGASGWFGRTTLALLQQTGVEAVLPFAQSTRDIQVDGSDVRVFAFDTQLAKDFAPTHIIDCAFLTREKVSQMGVVPYVQGNLRIIEELLGCIMFDTVQAVVSFSSGAATGGNLGLSEDPYGNLKRFQETLLHLIDVQSQCCVVVPRVWAVSGAYVQKVEAFAFSDLLQQASRGEVIIRSRRPVVRSYALIDDVIAMALISTFRRKSRFFDTGGEEIELSPLVSRMCSVLDISPRISRDPVEGPADSYASTSDSWFELAAELNYEFAGLNEQISLASRTLH